MIMLTNFHSSDKPHTAFQRERERVKSTSKCPATISISNQHKALRCCVRSSSSQSQFVLSKMMTVSGTGPPIPSSVFCNSELVEFRTVELKPCSRIVALSFHFNLLVSRSFHLAAFIINAIVLRSTNSVLFCRIVCIFSEHATKRSARRRSVELISNVGRIRRIHKCLFPHRIRKTNTVFVSNLSHTRFSVVVDEKKGYTRRQRAKQRNDRKGSDAEW